MRIHDVSTNLLVLTLSIGIVASTFLIVGFVSLPGPGLSHPGEGFGLNTEMPNPCVGTITDEPNRTTLFTIQGYRPSGETASLLVGVHPNGSVVGIHNDSAHDRRWVYDVDHLPGGDLLLAATEPGITVIEEIHPTTGNHSTVKRFGDVLDAHDVDRIDEHEWVLVDKHPQHNRVLVYNQTREAVVWEYHFDDHPEDFPIDGGGPYQDDWTHVNDVEVLDENVFMVSIRNFDQVVAIDRDSSDVVWRLGEDDDHSTLFEQHNPDYLQGENDTPTVLVADSENDRVVEYARDGDDWTRTWVLSGGLHEPRDADRLPNGNTLIAERMGHRILEVTPEGDVVWEFYAPWQPYDVERYGLPDESNGPTTREMNATGTYRLDGSAGFGVPAIEHCYDFLASWNGGSGLVPDRTSPSSSSPQFTDRQFEEPRSDSVQTLLAGGGLIAVVVTGIVLWRRLVSTQS